MLDADADGQRRLDLVSALLNFMNGFADDIAFAQPASWLCPSLAHLCHGDRCAHLESVEMSYAAAKDRCERVGRQLDDVMAAPPFNMPREKTERQSMSSARFALRGLDDSSMKQLALFLASGALPQLRRLDLRRNQIGDAGMQAFESAVAASGSLPQLQELYLGGNQIGDGGMQAFASAVASGSLPNLKTLSLWGNKIGDVGMQAFAFAVASPELPKLEVIYIGGEHPGLQAACQARGIRLE